MDLEVGLDVGQAEVLNRLFFAGFGRRHVLYHAAQEPICGVEIVGELARHGYSPGTAVL